ncbi:folate receptor gamma isoform X2 [Anabrus simplex]|uniref:folate receptor gamma isoform X2 n=1 Tax=Anabrus simplex TaxID=316456 RepID=UPI0034DD0D10
MVQLEKERIPQFFRRTSTNKSITVAGQLTRDRDRLLNWCLDGQNHKSSPGPEAELYSQCTPWKERSCCTFNTTKDVHHSYMYNFDWNHCSHINRTMSEACKRHFQQDLCFYECSPNIGPWVVTVQMKIRNERFVDVPLCQSDCHAWFNACAKDFTCVQNWVRDFNWKGGKNVCPPESECRTFEDIFKTDKNFCEKVWDHSWKFTSDAQPCMRLWFDGSLGNPNDGVAKLYAQKLVSSSASCVISSLNFIVILYVPVFLSVGKKIHG